MIANRHNGYVVLLSLLAAVLTSRVLAQSPCGPSPRTDCRRSQRGELLVKNDGDPSGTRLAWHWRYGEATRAADFGDPASADGYQVCLYTGPGHDLVFAAGVPGGPSWRSIHRRAHRYRDSSSAVGGVKWIGLGSGADGKAHVSVVARDTSRFGPTFRLPVTIQFVSSATDVCWESVYAADDKPEIRQGVFRVRQRGTPRPNVILITTDDQAAQTLSFMPSTLAELVSRGVTFGNAFSSNPVCLPSRASILTGNYPHTHGVRANGLPDGGALKFVGPDRQTIAVWLQADGYRTAFFGKYHGYRTLCRASGCPVPPGWDEFHAFLRDDYFSYKVSDDGAIVAHGDEPEDYSTDVMRDEVLSFLDDHPDEPFFVHFTPFASHASPSSFGLPVPAPRHADAPISVPVWRPTAYLEADVSDKPAIIQALPAVPSSERAFFNDLTWLQGLRSLLAVDEAIGAIVAKLEAQGRLTDTLIIFTSDQGYSHGEHRWFGKLCPYEECIRVPLVMRYPRVLRDRAASRDELAMHIDLAPTIAEWARVPAGRVPPIDGRSLAGIAEGKQSEWRDTVLLEQWQLQRYSGVRTPEWKYVLYETGERELYDLMNDSVEMTNVIDQFPAIADELEGRILELGGSLP